MVAECSLATSVNRVVAAGHYGVALRSHPILPRWRRQIRTLVEFPQLLRLVVNALSNEVLGSLTPEEARSLYQSLRPFQEELRSLLNYALNEKRPVWAWAFRFWLRCARIEEMATRIDDIVEALAWGVDEELSSFARSAVARLEYQDDAKVPTCHAS